MAARPKQMAYVARPGKTGSMVRMAANMVAGSAGLLIIPLTAGKVCREISVKNTPFA